VPPLVATTLKLIEFKDMDHLPFFFVKPFRVLARLHCRFDWVERSEELQYSEIDLPDAFAFFVKAPGLFIADCIHFFFAIYCSFSVRTSLSCGGSTVAFKLFNHIISYTVGAADLYG
jgi:hypothetical protein